MPVVTAASAQSPRAGNGWPSRITDDATSYQADWPSNDCSGHRAKRRVAYPVSGLRTERHKRSGNHNKSEYFLHVPLPQKDANP
jgi:hypothetical protein